MSGQCDALTRGTTATCSYANKVTIYNCRIIDTRSCLSRAAARRAIPDYVGWHNGTRLHSILGSGLGQAVTQISFVGRG